MKYVVSTVFILVLTIFGASLASAVGAGDFLSIDVSPTYPSKGDTVTITLQTYAFDIDRSNISWTLNGKSAISGIGQKTYSFVINDNSATVDIDVVPADQPAFKKTIRIATSSFDILWEGANSYVPPFYKGRPLPSEEGRTRITVIPSIENGSGKTFAYSWKRNDRAILSAGGYQKNTLVYETDYLNQTDTIEVNATEVVSGQVVGKTFDISIYQPLLLFYEKNPIQGILYNKALQNNDLVVGKEDKTIVVEPFYFNPTNKRSPDLKYTWGINGKQVENPNKKDILTLKQGSAKGSAIVSLTIENAYRLFLEAGQALQIKLQ